MMSRLNISGLGCTLLDTLYHGVDFRSDSFLRYASREPGDGGLSPGHLVFLEELERFSGQSFEVMLRQLTGERPADAQNVGGPAVVSVIHASQLLQDAADFRFVAALGNDPNAERILEMLSLTPLPTHEFIRKPARSPFTIVLSDPGFHQGAGERTFINNIGAAGKFHPEDLPAGFFETDLLTLGGTALVPLIHDHLDELLQQAAHVRFRLVNTVFDFRHEQQDPGKPWPLGKGHEALAHMELLVMDHDEALRISASATLSRAIRYFAESPLPAFIITSGPDPVWFYTDPAVYGSHGIPEPRSLPVSDLIVRELRQGIHQGDTTGAGDNFTGGIIYNIAAQLSAGRDRPDLQEAVRWGIVSGGFACTYMGGTYLESYPGEKMEKLQAYHDHYIQQLRNG